jgi:molybdate transport system ATP-binding protein
MSGGLHAYFAGRRGGFALDVAFAAPARGVTGLFGPSGCGKTSVLRAVAGLTRLDGRCALGDETWQDETRFVSTHRRPIGYVFQEASLFPHLSARGNLLFGAPKVGGAGFDEIVALLGLGALLDRAPQQLSGGERQRVALGRALLSQPRLLLLDEPMSALDAAAKAEILPFLERLLATMAIPALYVSHDIGEIERLADHLVLMRAGRIVASGPLDEVQSDPALPLAAAREAAVSLPARVARADAGDGLMALAAAGANFLIPRAPGAQAGDRLRLRIAAGDVSLARSAAGDATILNAPPARIVSATPLNEAEMLVVLRLGEQGEGARVLARVTHRSWARLGFAPGERVHAQIKGVALMRAGAA